MTPSAYFDSKIIYATIFFDRNGVFFSIILYKLDIVEFEILHQVN